jgi:hypothetical protein
MLGTVHEGFGPGLILWHDLSNGQVNTGFCWGNPKERDHSEDAGVDGRIILRWIFRMLDVGAWIESLLLRVRIGGRHL